LTSVAIPGSVTSIGDYAFFNCSSLSKVFFNGNAPSVGPSTFAGDPATIYYLPGTIGWTTTFGGVPTATWALPYPLILKSTLGFVVQSNGFGFTISWATNLAVVVEASTNLANPTWQPLQTNALTNGSFYFRDLQWTSYPGRFYRIRSP
jgi:hypothetical protein